MLTLWTEDQNVLRPRVRQHVGFFGSFQIFLYTHIFKPHSNTIAAEKPWILRVYCCCSDSLLRCRYTNYAAGHERGTQVWDWGGEVLLAEEVVSVLQSEPRCERWKVTQVKEAGREDKRAHKNLPVLRCRRLSRSLMAALNLLASSSLAKFRPTWQVWEEEEEKPQWVKWHLSWNKKAFNRKITEH